MVGKVIFFLLPLIKYYVSFDKILLFGRLNFTSFIIKHMTISLQAKYIAQCMEEIKLELRQDNINVKCNAVAKLTYVSLSGKIMA